jgi:thioredoxin reductase (NADPH)
MYDLIIIGAGPAGLTAALYAGRFRLNTLVLEKLSVGGQIILSSTIENYPGFPGGIGTYELIDKFKQQIDELGVPIQMREATSIVSAKGENGQLFQVTSGDAVLEAKSVIVATGAHPKRLGVQGEERLTGKGVSYCGTCDGPFFRNKDIIVVGGGDRALEEALFLTGYAAKVYVVHRRSAFRASKIVEEKAKAHPKISLILDSVLEEIKGEMKVEGVTVRNVVTGNLIDITCQGVFVFIGINPNTYFLKNSLEIDEAGFIITQSVVQTSLPGIFACGDCCRKSLYQVVTACGEGAAAADAAYKYIVVRG